MDAVLIVKFYHNAIKDRVCEFVGVDIPVLELIEPTAAGTAQSVQYKLRDDWMTKLNTMCLKALENMRDALSVTSCPAFEQLHDLVYGNINPVTSYRESPVKLALPTRKDYGIPERQVLHQLTKTVRAAQESNGELCIVDLCVIFERHLLAKSVGYLKDIVHTSVVNQRNFYLSMHGSQSTQPGTTILHRRNDVRDQTTRPDVKQAPLSHQHLPDEERKASAAERPPRTTSSKTVRVSTVMKSTVFPPIQDLSDASEFYFDSDVPAGPLDDMSDVWTAESVSAAATEDPEDRHDSTALVNCDDGPEDMEEMTIEFANAALDVSGTSKHPRSRRPHSRMFEELGPVTEHFSDVPVYGHNDIDGIFDFVNMENEIQGLCILTELMNLKSFPCGPLEDTFDARDVDLSVELALKFELEETIQGLDHSVDSKISLHQFDDGSSFKLASDGGHAHYYKPQHPRIPTHHLYWTGPLDVRTLRHSPMCALLALIRACTFPFDPGGLSCRIP